MKTNASVTKSPYTGYSSFLGYYSAMTEDYWAHTHSTGDNAPGGCKGDGLGGLWSALSNNTGQRLGHSLDNGTYESTLFGDRAVDIIEVGRAFGTCSIPTLTHSSRAQAHDVATPLFLYIAFHNEHDPHQAPRAAIDKYSANIKSDTYKVPWGTRACA